MRSSAFSKKLNPRARVGIHALINNAGIALDYATKYSNGKPDSRVGPDPKEDSPPR